RALPDKENSVLVAASVAQSVIRCVLALQGSSAVAVREKFSIFSNQRTLRRGPIGISLAPVAARHAGKRNSHRSKCSDVQALLDATLRQQLQGPPCAGAVECALSRNRDRHPARREPYAGVPCEESQRPGAAARSRGWTLSRRIQRHPLVCGRRHA